MKKIDIKNKNHEKVQNKPSKKAADRKKLEQKVVKGARKAVKDYKRVFERLSEYDKT